MSPRETPAAERAAPRPARGGRLLTLAPGHSLWDERVLRTVRTGRRFYDSVLALDHEILAAAGPDAPERLRERLGRGVEVVALPPWPRTRGLARVTRQLHAYRIARQARALAPDVVHIHETGVLGLLVAFWLRRLLPGCRIIFDYHDWIPWEVAASMRYVRPLYAGAMRVSMPLFRRMARGVDTAVCISPGQARWTREQLGIRKTVVMQNVRPRLAAPPFGRTDTRPQLVWAGHVMRMRRLEEMVDVVRQLHAAGVPATLSICGDVTEPAYADEVRRYAAERGVEESLVFHGRYGGDADLARLVGPGALGLATSVAEPIDTGINPIASANKFFSYMTLGVPMLLESAYENMADIAVTAGAGLAFASVDECARAALRVWSTPGLWEQMSRAARGVSERMNADVYEGVLEELYA